MLSDDVTDEARALAQGTLDEMDAIEGADDEQLIEQVIAPKIQEAYDRGAREAEARLEDHREVRKERDELAVKVVQVTEQLNLTAHALATRGAITPPIATGALPVINAEQRTQRHVVDLAERALARLGVVYVRGRQLVHVVRDRGSCDWLKRPDGTPVISQVRRERLQELLNAAAIWQVKASHGEWRLAACPAWVVDTLLAREEWGLPSLEGIVSAPTLRPDGTILDTPGYDPSTRLIYDPGDVEYPTIASAPTRDDADRALTALLEPFCDFPFVGETDMAATIALILSIVGRGAIGGNVPMFLSTAPTPGSGKGLLVDAAAIIATGRAAPKMVPTSDENETRKRLLALALESPPMIALDNVEGELGSASLAMALTSGEVTERLLGASQSVTASLRFVWCATGNNVALRGDLGRRVIPIGLDPKVEHPEDRHGFRHRDLIGYVREHRPRLVVAALTILRAYLAAGAPAHGRPAKGSFEAWDALVRGAVMWTCGVDPLAGVARIREAGDGDLDALRALLHAWRDRYQDAAVSVSDALLSGHQGLRDAIAAIAPKAKDVSAVSVGKELRKLADRPADGLKLQRARTNRNGVVLWRVVSGDA